MSTIAFKKHDGTEELHGFIALHRVGNLISLDTQAGPITLDLDLGDAYAMNDAGKTVGTYRADKPSEEDWSRATTTTPFPIK